MGIITFFFIKSFVASGILYLYYLVALKNKNFHSYNRFYLLLSVLISLIAPFINFRWFYLEASPGTPLNNFVTNIASPVESHPVPLSATGSVLFIISVLVSVFFLFCVALKIIWIYRVKRTGKNTKMNGFTFIETDVKQAPFSFLSNLFWRHGLSATDTHGERIFKHELAHISQKHTYDKLFTQIVCCMLWINPFYWLIQRELNTIHEFIADAASVADGDTESFAKMLLYSHNQGSYFSPSHPFFNSSIKRRLIMISSSNKPQYSYLRRILVLPITLFVLTVLTVNVKAQKDTKQTNNSSRATITPATQTLEPKTVTGYKSKKPVQGLDTIPSANSQQEITVIGYKSKKPVQGLDTTPSANSQQEITVIGYKSKKKTDEQTNTIPAEQSLEPITVTGYKSQKDPALQPLTVTGYKSEMKTDQQANTILPKQQSLEPIAVIGYKSQKDPAQQPLTVTGHKAEKKTDQKDQ